MAVSENRNYPLPDETRDLDDEIRLFQTTTIPMIDLDIQSLFDALGGKADIGHDHAIGDVTGLQAALDAKMPASFTFTLAGLADVVGVAEAPDGYVLIKLGSQMVAQAAAAALGEHSHSIAQVTNLQAALNLKAPLASPVLTGTPQGPTAAPGTSTGQLATTAFVQAAIAALNDFWALQPIGVPIPVADNIAGISSPPTGQSYRYIKLTASDAYNTGVLTGESISGSAPDLTATAVVNLAGSPINGQTVPLINTDRRFLRAGSAGTKEQSQNKSHAHTGSTSTTGAHAHTVPSEGSASAGLQSHLMQGGGSVSSSVSTSSTGNHAHTLSINSDGGSEARPANLGVTYFMRIK